MYKFCYNKNLQNDTMENVKIEASSADTLLMKQCKKKAESER